VFSLVVLVAKKSQTKEFGLVSPAGKQVGDNYETLSLAYILVKRKPQLTGGEWYKGKSQDFLRFNLKRGV
tara:strand:+ start:271 stop:480 length:210 start_codon:yes stop_codon:yes gene_type:complete